MRIVQLHWAFPPVVGGVETHLEELGAALVRRGHRVHALVGGEVAQEEQHRGVLVTRDPVMDLRNRPSRKEVLDRLLRFVDQERPDLIHAHNMHYFSPAHAEALVSLKEQTDLPILLTAHNAWDDPLGRSFLQFTELWDRIIAVSHYLADILVAQGYPRARMSVVHHGIDPTRWSAEPPGDDIGRTIFHPARLSIDKGSLVVVRAFRKVLDAFADARLILAGTGPIVDFESRQAREVSEVKSTIERLGLATAVTLEAIPWRDIPRVFRSARVVVYPSRFDEPFGIAALEGMASSRPVVVSRVGGMPEFVRDGIDGYIVPSDDPDALADRILRLLKDPELTRHLGRNARQRAVRDFHLDRMVSATLDVYEAVLKHREPLSV